jgi:FixJ family two-component response regulator
MADKVTVFVVDDDPGARRSLCWLIQEAGLFVRAFRSGREFLEQYRPQEGQGGCLVVDLRMPEMGGLEVQRRLREYGSELPVIFLTAHGDVPACAQAFKAGAFEFLEKPVDHTILLKRIRNALARSKEHRSRGEFAIRLGQLTPSEKEVFDLLISGRSLKEIANVRNVAVQTIWKHRLNILQKMGVGDDLELVRLAATQPPDEPNR